MPNQVNANTGCHLFGEYVDEAELATNLALHPGEAVRPQVVANYIDFWAMEGGVQEFTVLLHGPARRRGLL